MIVLSMLLTKIDVRCSQAKQWVCSKTFVQIPITFIWSDFPAEFKNIQVLFLPSNKTTKSFVECTFRRGRWVNHSLFFSGDGERNHHHGSLPCHQPKLFERFRTPLSAAWSRRKLDKRPTQWQVDRTVATTQKQALARKGEERSDHGYNAIRH